MTKLTATEVAALDPYKFMAVIGKRVIRKMAWLMPRMAKAVPYLGYILITGRKPR